MTRDTYFTLAQANAMLPAVRASMSRIVQLRSRAGIIHRDLDEAGYPAHLDDEDRLALGVENDNDDPPNHILRDAGKLRAVYAAIADNCSEIETTGAILEDTEDGVVEWLAKYGDRDVWLFWRFGDDTVNFWHDMAGSAGLRPVAELDVPAAERK
jgi:hypothetical protein